MFSFAFLFVLAIVPAQYHSLGIDLSNLMNLKNSTVKKGFNQICEYFCDGSDYSDELEDIFYETQPRVLCWICNKKVPTTTTTVPTTRNMTVGTPSTPAPGPTTTTVSTPAPGPTTTTTTTMKTTDNRLPFLPSSRTRNVNFSLTPSENPEDSLKM